MIHRLWLGPGPTPLGAWGDAAVRACAAGDVTDWTGATLPDPCVRVMDRLADRAGADRVRHAANVARWWLLAEYGGTWLDHDLVPLEPIAGLPVPATAAHGALRCPCFVSVTRGDPSPAAMLAALEELPPDPHGRAPDVSGDQLLTRLAPPGAARLQLPYGPDGRPLRSRPWAVHLWASGGRVPSGA